MPRHADVDEGDLRRERRRHRHRRHRRRSPRARRGRSTPASRASSRPRRIDPRRPARGSRGARGPLVGRFRGRRRRLVRTASGSSTTNRLPRPGPSLIATIVPSCSSTSRRDSVRPMPSPPCVRSRCACSCVNMSKMRCEHGRLDADAGVFDRDRRRAAVDAARGDRGCGRRAACTSTALFIRFATACASRVKSASTHSGRLGQSQRGAHAPARRSPARVASTALAHAPRAGRRARGAARPCSA